jgi:hypothetical protein
MAAPQMQAYPTQIGIFPQFIARQSESLVLKEKVLSLSGDSFDIKTITGQPVFQVKGEVFSLSGRKHLSDMSGNVLFTIRKKLIALHATYYAEDANGNVLFEVKGKFSRKSSPYYSLRPSLSCAQLYALLNLALFFFFISARLNTYTW